MIDSRVEVRPPADPRRKIPDVSLDASRDVRVVERERAVDELRRGLFAHGDLEEMEARECARRREAREPANEAAGAVGADDGARFEDASRRAHAQPESRAASGAA